MAFCNQLASSLSAKAFLRIRYFETRLKQTHIIASVITGREDFMEATASTVPFLVPLIASLYRMAWMVEARDPYTGGHLWRVSQFSRLLAEDLDLPSGEVARITLGGFLHDLGKIGVPDVILNKPGRLDEHEYAVIKPILMSVPDSLPGTLWPI